MTALVTTQHAWRTRWRERIALLVTCVAASFIPGVVGSRFGPGDWYASLDKSPLTPPGWVFPVVWSALYFTMGVALWRYIEAAGARASRTVGVTLFAIQLVLNGLWSYLFFGLHRPDLALIDIVLLSLAIVAVIAAFARHARGAALLLVPYLGWVSFATYLNFEVWRLQ